MLKFWLIDFAEIPLMLYNYNQQERVKDEKEAKRDDPCINTERIREILERLANSRTISTSLLKKSIHHLKYNLTAHPFKWTYGQKVLNI